MKLHLLGVAIASSLLAPVAAGQPRPQDDHATARTRTLEELVVTASPLRQQAESVVRPVEVLAGEALDAAKATTLGETLSGLPGVNAGYFGPGVGRPVIRGLDGARIQVLSGGLSAQDASTVSADHATAIEPFLADQIEVLKGPATLLYGSGAIGGAVNVVDGRIPELLPERAVSGRAELRGNTVNDESTGMVRLDGAAGGNLALHVDLLRRHTDDVDIPGFPESAAMLAEEGEVPDPDEFGRLDNSAVDTTSAALGLSWIGARGFLGASVSGFETRYGIPGHAHEDHDDDEHGDDDHDDPHGEDAEEAVRIDLQQRRSELKGRLDNPFRGHASLRVAVANSNYRHLELEGDEIGTRFDNDATEGRIEVVAEEIAGWRNAYGLQHTRRDFAAAGEEAFVPPSLTRDTGLFWLAQRDFDRFSLELGARGDRVQVATETDGRREFDTLSLSAASRLALHDSLHLQLGVDRSERAPTAEELFSDGPHVATRGYEVGDPGLSTETANRGELGLHWHSGRIDAKAAVFRTRFDDFIYLAETGEEEDGLPLRQWQQGDARFSGVEAEARLSLVEDRFGDWSLRLFGDRVRADLDGGGPLPRIPADRVGSEMQWRSDAWRASLGAVRHASQRRVAGFEQSSEGYTLVQAHLSYHWDVGDIGWEVFLDGRNLTDREARPHTSFLRDLAPLPGRAVAFGVRAFF